MKKLTTRQLVESALMVAVATVLSLLKIDLPFGGGVTLASMLPIILISHRYGFKWGLFTAFVYSVLQLILGVDNVGYATKGVAVGIAVTFFLRFVCHFITGVWIWGAWMPEEFMGLPMSSPYLYSFLYNGWYMLAELIVTEILAMLLYKPLEKYFTGKN